MLGGLGLATGGLLCVALALEPDARNSKAIYYIVPPFLMISVAYLIPAFAGGIGLLRGAAWGRVVIAVLSFLLLLLIPVGTALGGFGLWALYWSGREPGQAAMSTPRFPARAAPSAEARNTWGLLLLMAAVGAGFVVAIGAGFRLNNDPAPAELRAAFYPAVLVLTLSVAGFFVVRPFTPPSERATPLNPWALRGHRKTLERERLMHAEARRLRAAELSADPARVKYALLIEAGEAWSDDQIAYDQDCDLLATCRHLQPIERAMRSAGLDVRYVGPKQARAACLINEPVTTECFSPAKSVSYKEIFYGGRAAEDNPAAFLLCEACQSSIDVLHPYESRLESRWFPSPPE